MQSNTKLIYWTITKTVKAIIIFFGSQRSFLTIFTPEIQTSTTVTMAGSLQIAAQLQPNSNNPHECLRYWRRCRWHEFSNYCQG